MTNVQRTASAISAVLLATAAGAVFTPATSYADPAGHQVTYTVTSPNNVTATVNYVSSDPPSQAAYNADSSKFMTNVQAPLSAGQPVTYNATLANPNQWASITASGMLHWPDSGNGPASFHCEIAVDGQVVAQQDATTTVTCTAPRG
ncbi:hypothetical protein [Mycobacterium mantenii]|uniref:Uncharacterized protein n=1 Tax=Mycobacterium mantenii TaxID=560555 RepID=A0A1A2TUU9_MYCNT|nr:hypothetical protein [Mycobacterium mantenii]OBH47782.1 hypothetical protein A5688_26435 [Mycobacterium mantenii]OBH53032.1 hypothetical protein A5687_07920 [Mycobacterium mantenii]OBH67698.1 hypothetical protein A5683_08890 [Mycobacterium mantenii]OBH80121.1 hypothetical protein A5682_16145 [Mycobacterium mantenii]